MKLTSTIIAAFLALSMAIFPISVVRAAAIGGHSHAGVTSATEHSDVVSAGADRASIGSQDDHAPCDDTSNMGGAACCGMVACHVFDVSASPAVAVPAGSVRVLHALGDEQVNGAVSIRIDRPPRTI